MPDPPPPPSQAKTVRALLKATKRDELPLRKSFVQQPDGDGYIGGPLKRLVANQDEQALDLYLLFHAKASGGDWSVTLGAPVWARALGRQANPTGLTAVSKAWNRLEGMKLVARSRSGRRARVELLREDGSGEPYTRPTSGTDRWLNLSYRYWLDDWSQQLSLPAKAMLLIALSLDDGFYLPLPKAQAWYGISRNTAQRGLAELVESGLLARVDKWVEEPLSDIGYRLIARYTLRPPFGPHSARKRKRAPAARKPRPTPTKKGRPSPAAGKAASTRRAVRKERRAS